MLEVKTELKADIVRLENRIDGMGKDMQAMELRLNVKLGTFVAVGIPTQETPALLNETSL